MNTTRVVFCAALTFSSFASVAAQSLPAWQAEGFVMEEVVVTASAPPAPEEIVVTAKASARLLVEEIAVAAQPPAVEVTPGVIVPPSFSDELDSRRTGVEESIVNVTPEASRTYAAREDAQGPIRRLF